MMDSTPLQPSPLAILFDLDDTLCDYAGARATRLRRAFSPVLRANPDAERAIDLDRLIDDSIQMHPHGVDHFGELFSRHGIFDPDAIASAADWYRGNPFHGLTLFPETAEVVRAMRGPACWDGAHHSRTVGVITNGPSDIQRAKLALLGIDALVDFVIVSAEFGAEKPDPAIFHEALRLAEVPAAYALVVGDSLEYDIAGAARAGIPSVWVNRRGQRQVAGGVRSSREIASLGEMRILVPG